MCRPHLVCALILGWTLGLLLPFGCVNQLLSVAGQGCVLSPRFQSFFKKILFTYFIIYLFLKIVLNF